jgi:hypothetical protein
MEGGREGSRERTNFTLTTYTLSDRTVALLFMVECGKTMRGLHITTQESVPPVKHAVACSHASALKYNCALQGCYAADNGKSLPTFRHNPSVPSWHTDNVNWYSAGQHRQYNALNHFNQQKITEWNNCHFLLFLWTDAHSATSYYLQL